MQTITLDTANIAQIIPLALHGPVMIRQDNQNAAVMLSAAEYKRITQNNVESFLALCERIGRKAEANGLTEEKLAALLADDE